jgi:U3 small nucleolar ribonucleoprotein component
MLVQRKRYKDFTFEERRARRKALARQWYVENVENVEKHSQAERLLRELSETKISVE